MFDVVGELYVKLFGGIELVFGIVLGFEVDGLERRLQQDC